MAPGKGNYATAGGSTPLASDTFDRANNADLGTSWDVVTGESSFQITSNTAEPSLFNSDCSESNNSVSWPNDQYSQAKVTVVGTTADAGDGVLVRADTGARTFHRAVVNKAGSDNIEIAKFVAGTYTKLANRTQAWTDTDVLRLEAIGTTLKVYRNGTQMGADISDSAISSGRPGVNQSGPVTSGFLDDWEGGSIP